MTTTGSSSVRGATHQGSGVTVTTRDPVTGEPLATLAQSTPDDVRDAFAAARAAQVAWAATPPCKRVEPFLALHDLALGNEQLIDLVQAETGKSRNIAFEETLAFALTAGYYGRRAPKILKPRRRPAVRLAS